MPHVKKGCWVAALWPPWGKRDSLRPLTRGHKSRLGRAGAFGGCPTLTRPRKTRAEPQRAAEKGLSSSAVLSKICAPESVLTPKAVGQPSRRGKEGFQNSQNRT